MPDSPPSHDELPILRELGDDLKAAFRTAPRGARAPRRVRRARTRRWLGAGVLAAATVIVAVIAVVNFAIDVASSLPALPKREQSCAAPPPGWRCPPGPCCTPPTRECSRSPTGARSDGARSAGSRLHLPMASATSSLPPVSRRRSTQLSPAACSCTTRGATRSTPTSLLPPYKVRPAARAGRYLLTPLGLRNVAPITITAAQLRGLRDGQDTILFSNQPAVVPYSSIVNRPLDIRKAALSLLRSGHAQVQGHVEVAGRTAIEISGPGRLAGMRNSYYVAPRTYQPLGMVQRFHGITVTLRLTAYQLLPETAANRELVTLPGAHPSARIDTSAADYNTAANRLLK